MTLIKPSPVENLFNSLWSLESDRPKYYVFVCRQANNIFRIMGRKDLLKELKMKQFFIIEKPMGRPFVVVSSTYDKYRWVMPKKGYVRVGDDVFNSREVTIFEIEQRLEAVKDWVYDIASDLSMNVRFTNQQPILA